MVNTDGQSPKEHTEAAAGTVRFLFPEVSPTSWRMGEATTVKVTRLEPQILNDNWVIKLRDREGTVSGEGTA